MASRTKIKEIVANRIVLKSPKGELRAWLDATDEDVVLCTFYGGRSTLTLGIEKGEPLICLRNKHDRVALSMGTSDHFGNGIVIYDGEGFGLCKITVSNEGLPQIALIERVSPNEGEEFWRTPAPSAPKQLKKPAKKLRPSRRVTKTKRPT